MGLQGVLDVSGGKGSSQGGEFMKTNLFYGRALQKSSYIQYILYK